MEQNSQHYLDLLKKFRDVRLMAVGDIYLDEYTEGSITEVSLEAPIPVLEVKEKRYNPGAAGNAACNAAALGAKTYMIGVVGADSNADIVRRAFAARNVNTDWLVVDPERPTNTYGKIRAGGHNIPTQEVLRTDTQKPVLISGEVEAAVVANIEKLAPEVDAIMLGDQAVSVLSERVLAAVAACAEKHNLVTVADSRKRAGIFKGIDIVVPNDAEAGLAAGIEVTDDASLEKAGKFLLQSAKNALVTRGPAGITVFAADGGVETVPIRPVRAVDVTGAGDTVAAAVALTMASGGSLIDAAYLGNMAAGIAVVQEGVVTVANAEVASALTGGGGPEKLKTPAELKPLIEKLKADGKRVVWTNGCFDILHVGHITYLLNARHKGDVLVVGLNSDRSVRENKGPDRPVVHEESRAIVLSALECVDYIILFDDRTPMKLLEELEPDVYAKGGDYTIDTIVQEERRLVEGYGGRIAIISGIDGESTTYVFDKIASMLQREQGG
jgi:D-beta-D-heptose 7-phosphate kinase / D-beta-D-heptose 1-phosphate adenosyltransferase